MLPSTAATSWVRATWDTKETPSLSINTESETHTKKATVLGNPQVTPRGVKVHIF